MLLKIIKSISMKAAKELKPEEPKSFARRDRLLEIEKQAQDIWKHHKFHEKEVDENRPKIMVTFPYPYMNGRLHLGHGFSLSKPEFYSRYKSLKGYNVLFPFGFHCTGMPISAASLKLKEEITGKFGFEKLDEIVQGRLDQSIPYDKQPMTQYEIMLMNHVDKNEISNFFEAEYWLKYFPSRGQGDLEKFGAAVDFRRSFITTSINPYYDSFIQWQFRKLKEKGFLKFGKRPSIYSEKDQQMCADHDRAEGEGVLPQEYTLIKLAVIEAKDERLQKLMAEGKKVVLPAATLRPETMYGQTNCFVLPEGEYGVYEMPNNEVWVTAFHAMRNLSFQEQTLEHGKSHQIFTIIGNQLIGTAVKAPLASYERVYVLPMLNISMSKGTGIVTSVPSDAPDDFAVLNELKKKKPFREKFGLTDEMVLPFEPVPIIETAKYGTLAAIKACQAFKVNSMNEHEKLRAAKDEVYTDGFYTGVMVVGEFSGKKVVEAKPLIRAKLIQEGLAAPYYEPESKCVSRSGDECVVALCDQWYLNYGIEEFKEKLKTYIRSSEFQAFNENIRNVFIVALDWLKEWGCSRSFGLGTRLPWDNQYLIESLSDSTIYMAYYTISQILHADLEGQTAGKYNVNASDFTDADWDAILLKKPVPADTKIPKEMFDEMIRSFEYWYPFDLRCSGKDLIKNHLTMSLYNHEYIWGTDGINKLPKGIFCNGWVLVDGEKMSKQKGNFLLLKDVCEKFSADVLRLTLANSGDSLDDANIEMKSMDMFLLRLSNLESWMKDLKKSFDTFRDTSEGDLQFFDTVFESEIKQIALLAEENFEKMVFREIVKEVFFNMQHIREEYKFNCGNAGYNKRLIKLYLEVQLLLLYPITPHFCEIMWTEAYLPLLTEEERALKPQYISKAAYPNFKPEQIDRVALKKSSYLKKLGKNIRASSEKILKRKKDTKITKVTFIVAKAFHDWQLTTLKYLQSMKFEDGKTTPVNDWKSDVKDLFKEDAKLTKKAMEFASFRIKEYELLGAEAFDTEISFNEKEFVEKYMGLILKDAIEIEQQAVIYAEDAAQSSEKSLNQNVDGCLPGNPLIVLDFK